MKWNETKRIWNYFLYYKEPILIYDVETKLVRYVRGIMGILFMSDFLKRDMEEKVLVKYEVSRQRWNLFLDRTE